MNTQNIEAILTRCFGDLVDNAKRELGAVISDAQRRDLIEFMRSDPVLRAKLLKYLGQIVE